MSQVSKILSDAGISRKGAGDCPCGGNILVYRIPIRLDGKILEYLKPMGEPAFDFEKSHLLRIENPAFIISGVKRLREVRFVLKNKEITANVEYFEQLLADYVNSVKGTE